VATLDRLVARVVEAGGHQSWGDMVTILATTALRISAVSGLLVGDVDLHRGLIHVFRQTYPGRGGLVTKETKGRRRRTVPVIEPLRPTLQRLTAGRDSPARLLSGPRGGVITTATLRDATRWDDVVRGIGQPGLVRHGLRHTALTWMADAGVELHILQRVAGHQDPAVTSRYLHPDVQAMLDAGGRRFGLVVPRWSPAPEPGCREARPRWARKRGLTCINRSGPIGRADRI
jgi:integrase